MFRSHRPPFAKFLLTAVTLGGTLLGLQSPAAADTSPSGAKSVLMIRAKYSDDTTTFPVGFGFSGSGGQLNDANAQDLLDFLTLYLFEVSFGIASVSSTTKPAVITLPLTAQQYASTGYGSGNGEVVGDATALSIAAGFDPANYDFTYFAVSNNAHAGSWPAGAYLGTGRIFMNGYWSHNTLIHEMGHAFPGGFHQGYSGAADVISNTTNSSTHHPFDALGKAGWTEPGSHYIALTKQRCGWVPAADILAIAQPPGPRSDIHEISALEDSIAGSGPYHALKVTPSGSGVWPRYWFEFRQGFPENNRLMNGVVLNGQLSDSDSIRSYALDLTPETLWDSVSNEYSDKADCPLVIGQTFADPARDIYVTPLRKLNASPEVIEVEVNFGPFSPNSPPFVSSVTAVSTTVAPNTLVVLDAIAGDLDGDPLSYYWQFEGASGNPLTQVVKRSEPTAEHIWANPGTYEVKCTASDRKGGTGSASIFITVSNSVTNTPPDVNWAKALVPLITSTGGTATLDANVTDPQSDPITSTWSLVSAPTGASPTIVSPTSLQTSVTGMTTSGSYVFRFIADDGAASTRVDTLVAVDSASVHDWGLGKITSTGSDPDLVPLGSPVVNSGGTFELQLRGGKPGAIAVLFFGKDASSLRSDPFNAQVYANNNIARKPEVFLDSDGGYTWNVPLTNSNFIGKSRTYQVFFRDGGQNVANGDGTFSGISSAVSLVFSDQ